MLEPKEKELEKQYKEGQQKYKELLVDVEKVKKATKLHLTPPQDPKVFADAVLEPVASRPIEVGDFLFITIDGE